MGIAKKVYKQEKKDFPKSSIQWIKSSNVIWSKRKVRLSEIDFSNSKNWQAIKNQAHIDEFVKLIKNKGYKKRVVLARLPGKTKLMVIDGHHRVLAWHKLGMKVPAYIGTMNKADGPWIKQHNMQTKREDIPSHWCPECWRPGYGLSVRALMRCIDRYDCMRAQLDQVELEQRRKDSQRERYRSYGPTARTDDKIKNMAAGTSPR